jgi:GH24 family phage-related lysozyme (muramidase)
MRTTVSNNFRSFNAKYEGTVKFMYVDVKNLVTIGVGNLIDPINIALGLPFKYNSKQGPKAGTPASRADIEAEWKKIKGAGLAKKGHTACEPLTKLELDEPTIAQLISDRLQSNVKILKSHRAFSKFEDWPADAQMGLLSMAWAMGAGFGPKWPRFSAACDAQDFDQAAENCRMKEDGNPGLVPRNRANRTLFQNAAAVLAGSGDANTFYFPICLLKPITITA